MKNSPTSDQGGELVPLRSVLVLKGGLVVVRVHGGIVRNSQPQTFFAFLRFWWSGSFLGWGVCGKEYFMTGRFVDETKNPGSPPPSSSLSVWACTSGNLGRIPGPPWAYNSGFLCATRGSGTIAEAACGYWGRNAWVPPLKAGVILH